MSGKRQSNNKNKHIISRILKILGRKGLSQPELKPAVLSPQNTS